MKDIVETLIVVFLVVVMNGYQPSLPSSPLPTPTPKPTPMPQLSLAGGVAGIGNCPELDILGSSFWYNWSPDDEMECGEGFIPTIRDSAQWTQIRAGIIEISPTILFGFNEPDVCPDQSCLTPLQALGMEHWRLEYYSNTLHVAPAPSQENITWIFTFRNLYKQTYGYYPDWDYLACHCYFWDDASLANCKNVVNQFRTWSNDWGLDGVIVNEFGSFAFRGSPQQSFDYGPAIIRGQNFIEWMRSKPNIVGWFWFSTHDWGVWPWYATTALFYVDELTPLGEMYQGEVQ